MSSNSKSCEMGGSSWGVSGERWTSAWEFEGVSARHDAENSLNKRRAAYRR